MTKTKVVKPMIHGVKWDLEGTFFCKKDHFCPKCDSKLEVVRTEKMVNSESPEAKQYDFSMADTYLMGNVKFVSKIFKCLKCGYTATVKQQKIIEKSKKSDLKKV
jgi:hypothetical protein